MRPNSKDRGPVNSSKDRPRQLRDVFLSHGWILEADFPHTPRMQHCDAQVRAAAPARALRPIFVITSSVTEPEQEPNARHPPHPPTPLPTTHPTVLRAERDARAAQCNYLRVLCDETLEELSVSACDKVHTPPYCSPYRSP